MRYGFRSIYGPDQHSLTTSDYAIALFDANADVVEMLVRLVPNTVRSVTTHPDRIAFCTDPTYECARFCYAAKTTAFRGQRWLCTRHPLSKERVPVGAHVVNASVDGIAYQTCDRYRPSGPKSGPGKQSKRWYQSPEYREDKRGDRVKCWLRRQLLIAQAHPELARAARAYMSGEVATSEEDAHLVAFIRQQAWKEKPK